MKYPIRLLVVERLCALIEKEPLEINGTSYNMKGAVFRGRNLLGEETKPLPMLSVIEAPRPDFALYAGEGFGRKDNLTLLITGKITDDKCNPSDNGYWFHAAVEERLSRISAKKSNSGLPRHPEDHMLGDLLASFDIAPPVVRPPDDKASNGCYFFLPVRLGIAVRMDEPYTEVP